MEQHDETKVVLEVRVRERSVEDLSSSAGELV